VPNLQKDRTLQQAVTSLSAAQVLSAAKEFFGRGSGIYAAFIEQDGPSHVSLRGLGGEEVVIGVAAGDGGTSVNASSYMFDQQIAMFLSSLPPVVSK